MFVVLKFLADAQEIELLVRILQAAAVSQQVPVQLQYFIRARRHTFIVLGSVEFNFSFVVFVYPCAARECLFFRTIPFSCSRRFPVRYISISKIVHTIRRFGAANTIGKWKTIGYSEKGSIK